MRSNAILRIVLYSIAIIALLGILIGGITLGLFMFDTNIHHETITDPPLASDQNETRSVVDDLSIRNIEIDWVSGSITLLPDPNCSDIIVSETGTGNKDYRMVCTTSSHTLKIQYCKDGINFPSFGITINDSISKDLVIKVPVGWVCDTLVIDTTSAEVTVSDLVIEKFDFDGASGVCRLQKCYVDCLDMDTASGNIYFEGTLNSLDCDAASASCEIIVYNTPKHIEMDMASGDLELTLPEGCGFTVDLTAVSGHFTSDFETTCKDDSHTHSVHTHGDGSCRIQVDAMSGDVSIHKAASVPKATIPYCTDPNCTNPNHDHSAVCTDEDCTIPNHSHSNHH